MVQTSENATIQRFVHENIINIQNRLRLCGAQLVSHNSACPSTLSLDLIDPLLKQFVLSHQKHFFHKMSSTISNIQYQIREIQLSNVLNSNNYFSIQKVIGTSIC